ncbi:unnamed protein product [Prorocentrum cordatum]|uniref:Phosphoinositide phospholipase C n=1 Tax=Prorocentrum cordatum TaxID=2364126 RepID=A0ABN9XUK3_9DINO|nr:unnamed protein product [Polarella glacialis]
MHNPTSNGWAGSMLYSTDGGNTYVSVACADCVGTTDSRSMVFDGNADGDNMASTQCLNGNVCSFIMLTLTLAPTPWSCTSMSASHFSYQYQSYQISDDIVGLTSNAQSAYGRVAVSFAVSEGFTIQFDMFQGGGSGADGCCMKYGGYDDNTWEDVSAVGLSVCFDSHGSDRGVRIGWNGDILFSDGQAPSFEDSDWHSVIVEVTPIGSGASVALNFDSNSYYKTAWISSYSPPIGSGQLTFTARNGLMTNFHEIKDVQACNQGTTGTTFWTLLARQTYPTLFTEGEWSKNAGYPENDNYAILDQIENYRSGDGVFTFKLSWPGSELQDQIWNQSLNPYTSPGQQLTRPVAGYEDVAVHYTDAYWGGLESVSTYALLDGSVADWSWWYAVGSFQEHDGGMPGPNGIVVNKVELYVATTAYSLLIPQRGCADGSGTRQSGWLTVGKPYTPAACAIECATYNFFTIAGDDADCKCSDACVDENGGHTSYVFVQESSTTLSALTTSSSSTSSTTVTSTTMTASSTTGTSVTVTSSSSSTTVTSATMTSSSTVTTVLYDVLTHGQCDRWIMYIDGCTLAAYELNLSTVPAIDDEQSGGWSDPPFCYLENSKLKFNSDGSNKGSCSQGDQCICASVSPTYTATSETTTTRTGYWPPTLSPTFAPTPAPTEQCFDLNVTENVTEWPGWHEWYDTGGPTYNCDWYGTMNCPSDSPAFRNFGHIAQEACCACGGGQDELSQKVSVGITVQGVDFVLLSQNEEVQEAFKGTIQITLASAAGVNPDNVDVELYAGSVFVVATIRLPTFIRPQTLSQQLGDNSRTMADNVADEVQSIPNMDSVINGEISAVVDQVVVLTNYNFIVVTDGSCQEPITNDTLCEAAAVQLGLQLPDTTPLDDGQSGSRTDPPGCYLEDGTLKINSGGGNTGSCDATDQCLCFLTPTPAPTSSSCPSSCFGLSCDEITTSMGDSALWGCLALESTYFCDCAGCSCEEYCSAHSSCSDGSFCKSDGTCAACSQCEHCYNGIDSTCGLCGNTTRNESCQADCQDTAGRATFNAGEGIGEAGCGIYSDLPEYCLLSAAAYDDEDFTASLQCCSCGGGSNPRADAVWHALGPGTCRNHDADWQQSDELGPGWGLQRGFGWRMCDGRTDEACQQVCAQTPGCSMISNGFCCFLFKGSTCDLDASQSGQSFSTGAAGSELCVDGCNGKTTCRCGASMELCTMHGLMWCSDGSDAVDCGLPVTGTCSACEGGCSVGGSCNCSMGPAACEAAGGVMCDGPVDCSVCPRQGIDPAAVAREAGAAAAALTCGGLRQAAGEFALPLACAQVRTLYAGACCTPHTMALSIRVDSGGLTAMVSNGSAKSTFEDQVEATLLSGREGLRAAAGSGVWVDSYAYCRELGLVTVLLAATEVDDLQGEEARLQGSLDTVTNAIATEASAILESGKVRGVTLAQTDAHFDMEVQCARFTSILSSCNAIQASAAFVQGLRDEYDAGFLRACAECGSQRFHDAGCVGDESYPWPAPAPGCFKPSQSCFARRCAPGTSSSRSGMISPSGCEACAPGRFADASGQSECLPCERGTHQSASGATQCETCPLGRFAGEPAAVECAQCQVGFFTAVPGSAACSPCPDSFVAAPPGSANLSVCICDVGWRFDPVAQRCVTTDCGEYLRCPGGYPQTSAQLDTSVSVLEGYMTLAGDPFSVYECVDRSRCSGDRQVASAEMCSAGFDITTPRCARCPDGMYLNGSTKCEKCEDDNSVYFKAAAAFIIQALTILYMYKRFNVPNPSGAITVGAAVTFLQTLQALSRLDIDWPTALVVFFERISMFTLPGIGQLFQFNMECWTGNSVFWDIATQALSPLVVFLDFLLLHGLWLIFSNGLKFNFVHNVIGLIFTKMNISVTGLTLSLFYRKTMPNAKIMVQAFPELEFGVADWWSVLPLNVLTTLFFGVTIFSYVCWIVWTAPRRSMTVPGFGARYRFCFGSVRPDRFWWIIVQLTYGILINLTQVVFPAKDVSSQVYFLLLKLIFVSILQFRVWPFKFDDNNWVDLTFKLSLVVGLIMATAWVDNSTADEQDMSEAGIVYSWVIIICFGWAFVFASCNFMWWLWTACCASDMTQGRLAQTVWNLRDVSAAMLMLEDKDLVARLQTIGDHDMNTLRQATTTMIHVFFGRQVSLHRRRRQRMIMGGGFRAWDHNATVLQLLKDAESGLLETHVLQSSRFRLSLLKLTRAALAMDGPKSYRDQSELHPEVHKKLVLNRRDTLGSRSSSSSSSPPRSADFSQTSRSSPIVDSPMPLLTKNGSSGSWSSKAMLQALLPSLASHLDAKKAAKALQLGKGEVTREVFVDTVQKKFGYLHLPAEHVNAMFSCMDADNSGTVSVYEFTRYMMANTPPDLVYHFTKDMEHAWMAAAGHGAADLRVSDQATHSLELLAMVHRNEVEVWRNKSHLLSESELSTMPIGELIRATGPRGLDLYDDALQWRPAAQRLISGDPSPRRPASDILDVDRVPVAQTSWIFAEQSALSRGFAID